MDDLASPSSVPTSSASISSNGFGNCVPQKIVANSAYRFVFPPAIELLGAAIPKVNPTLHAASHDADELKNILKLLQRRHCFLQWRSAFSFSLSIFVPKDRAKEKGRVLNMLLSELSPLE